MTSATKGCKELKAAPRRAVRYASLDELSRDLDAIEAGHRAGTLVTSGNWTPGENLHHCAKTWLLPIDGFPPDAKPPAMVKFVVKTFFKKMAVSGKPAPIGIKFPKGLEEAFGPKIGASYDEGMNAMREAVARTRSGERFTHASPLFGTLTHDEWLRLLLGHSSMHLSFLHPQGLTR